MESSDSLPMCKAASDGQRLLQRDSIGKPYHGLERSSCVDEVSPSGLQSEQLSEACSSSSSQEPDPEGGLQTWEAFRKENPYFCPDGGVVNKFEVLSMIGKGNFSWVHLGKNHQSGEEVAIKELNSKKVRGDDIQNEVAIMTFLSHKNIVTFQGYYVFKATTFALVMEKMEADLETLAFRGKPLEEALELTVVFEVLNALAYMSRREIIHYDIKPANILLSRAPQVAVKVGDFGLSAHQSEEPQQRGTCHYSAPELFHKDQESGQPSCDVWSLGITMLSLCLRCVPHGQRDTDSYRDFLKELIEYPVNKMLDDCKASRSDSWKNFLGSCLTVKPLKRPTAAELLNHKALEKRAPLQDLEPCIHEISNP